MTASTDSSPPDSSFEVFLRAAAEARSPARRPLPPLERGRRLGHYEIEGILGEGGMGAVYAARDLRLERRVALKLVAHVGSASAKRWRRLQTEARALAAVDHPRLATVYSLELEDGLAFITMERVQGETLRDRIERGRVAPSEVVRVALQISEGLALVHELGIVHRDIKPENVILDELGNAKLIDFGLAKFLADDGDTLTSVDDEISSASSLALVTSARTGIVGTPAYMAPEQGRGEQVSASADVWAMGLVMAEMLAGTREVGPSELDAPRALVRIIERCLEREALRRPLDGGALHVLLAGIERRGRRLRRGAFALLGAGLLGLSAAGWSIVGALSVPSDAPPRQAQPETAASIVAEHRLVGVPANLELQSIARSRGGLDLAFSSGELLEMGFDGQALGPVLLGPRGQRLFHTTRVNGTLHALAFDTEAGQLKVWRREAGRWSVFRSNVDGARGGPGGRFAWSPTPGQGSTVRMVVETLSADGSAKAPARTIDMSTPGDGDGDGPALVSPLAFSPSGTELLVFRRWSSHRSSLDVYSLESGEWVERVATDAKLNGGAVWATHHQIYFLRQGGEDGRSSNLWVGRYGGGARPPAEPRPVSARRGRSYTHLVAGRQPGELAFVEWLERDDIWVGELGEPLDSYERCLTTTFDELSSSWSKDGRLFAALGRPGDLDAVIADCERHIYEPLLEGPGWQTWAYPGLEPDQVLVLNEGEDGETVLSQLRLGMQGTATPLVRLQPGGSPGAPGRLPPNDASLRCASEAGRCVMAVPNEEGQLAVRELSPSWELGDALGPTLEVGELRSWELSVDGRWFASFSPSTGKVRVLDLEDPSATSLPVSTPPSSMCTDVSWSPANELYGLCLGGPDLLEYSLYRLPWGSGRETEEAKMLMPKWTTREGFPQDMSIDWRTERVALSLNHLDNDIWVVKLRE